MRIAVGFATQGDIILTPQFEPGAAYVTVQLQDDEGLPISDVHLIPVSGRESDIYLMPLLIMGLRRDLFPSLVNFFQKAIRFAVVNGGQFNAAAFIDAEHKALHTPVVLPPVPQPSPVIPSPVPLVTGALTESIAQVEIDSVARKYGLTAPGAVVRMPTVPGAFSRNYNINGKLCLVVCTGPKDATFLIKNDFFLNYTGDNYGNRARLGPPIEDERSVQGGAEQRFKKGRMFWSATTLKVTVFYS